MINAKLQNIIDTKSAIGNAIVNKGGTITSETPFFNYAAQIDGISTGTPQTIFQASDGSKWALTNAVNLVNDAGNVTSDFNYWQPANNSTSDPILNVGTVNGNISGNIRIVQLNQVNISQYENIVINDTTGAKYVGYNGIDSQTNPTPSGNVVFNRWVLNNSATGTVLFANTVITNAGTYNGPNTSVNNNLVLNTQTNTFGGQAFVIASNNGFIYVGGETSNGTYVNSRIRKYHQSNLSLDISANNLGNWVTGISVNNGRVFTATTIGGFANSIVSSYHESNLVLISNSVNFGTRAQNVATNNSFVYVSGTPDSNFTNGIIRKYHESNLVLQSSSSTFSGRSITIAINNASIYIGSSGVLSVRKMAESNLTITGNTDSYGGQINQLKTNNGFIYAAGSTTRRVRKYHESNLVFVGETAQQNEDIFGLEVANDYIYIGYSSNRPISVFYENNLAFVTNTSSNVGGGVECLRFNNSSLFSALAISTNSIQKYDTPSITFDNQTFYTATKIKE